MWPQQTRTAARAVHACMCSACTQRTNAHLFPRSCSQKAQERLLYRASRPMGSHTHGAPIIKEPYWGNPPTHVPTHVYTRQGTISGTCDASFWSPANQSVLFPVLGHGLRHVAPRHGSSRKRASRPSDTKRRQPISAELRARAPTTSSHLTSPHPTSHHLAALGFAASGEAQRSLRRQTPLPHLTYNQRGAPTTSR